VVWVSLAIILAAEIVLAIFGHATIIAAEKWIAVVLAVLFAGLAAFVLPHTSLAIASQVNHGGGSFSTWLIAMGIVFSYPIGWANFASDYSRYFLRKRAGRRSCSRRAVASSSRWCSAK
jgi:NCS1 family nucleobase:cation symporter-1